MPPVTAITPTPSDSNLSRNISPQPSRYDLMKSLVAICLTIIIINIQFMAIHMNAYVNLSPLSVTTSPSEPATTKNPPNSTLTMNDVLLHYQDSLLIAALTPNLLGQALLICHSMRSRPEILFNLLGFLGVGWCSYAISEVYSPSVATILAYATFFSALFVALSESSNFRRMSNLGYDRLVLCLRSCIKAICCDDEQADQLLPLVNRRE